MTRFLWICLGGAAGTGARYLMCSWILRTSGAGFPYGTLAVNLLGSLLLGLLMAIGTESVALPPTARLALTAGVLGGFTTYSTFSYETMRLFLEGKPGIAVLNVLVAVVACLAACLMGWGVARWLIGP